MNKIDERFAKKIGAEYKLFPLASPHYLKAQQLVASYVADERHRPGAPILEIGCGTGLTTKELRQRMPQAPITAIDVEEVMLRQARNLVGDSLTSYVCEDANVYLDKCIAEGQHFDRVVTAFGLHNMSPAYRHQTYVRIEQVLNPGGVLVVADKIAQDDILKHWAALKAQIDAFEVFERTDHPELRAEWTAHYLKDEENKLTVAEQEGLFCLAGCPAPFLRRRWGMDALYSGIKQG